MQKRSREYCNHKHHVFIRFLFVIAIIYASISIQVTYAFDNEQAMKWKTLNPASVQPYHTRIAAMDRTGQWYLDRLHVSEAQSYIQQTLKKRPGEGVTIAIVDTGVDDTHPDLQGVLLPGINLINRQAKAVDDNGHGTMIAGVIAGQGQQASTSRSDTPTVQGIAPGVKILPIKALDNLGRGDSRTVAQGVLEAVKAGVDIIVLSLTDPIDDPSMRQAIERAEKANVLVVAAAGNDSSRTHYPANYPTVLGVGAIDMSDHPTPFTNYGDGVDLVAYGQDIFTTTSTLATPLGRPYVVASGTSLAAPQVAAVAALVKQLDPKRTALDIRDILKATAAPLKEEATYVGFGKINALKAVTTDGVPVVYENNTSQASAPLLALGKDVRITLSPDEAHWFYFQPSYPGKIFLSQEGLADGWMVQVDWFDAQGKMRSSDVFDGNKQNQTITIDVQKVKQYARLKLVPATGFTDSNQAKKATFVLKPRFIIYDSHAEAIDDPKQALTITLEDASAKHPLIGTLAKDGQMAWFQLKAPHSGILTIRAESDDSTLDLVLYVQVGSGSRKMIDENGLNNGINHEETTVQVRQGEIVLIGLSNYDKKGVNAEYALTLTLSEDMPDIRGHWSEASIRAMLSQKFIQGFPDGLFHPDQSITRAQLITMLVKRLDLPPLESLPRQSPFRDLSTEHWAYADLIRAYQFGLLKGYIDQTVHPDAIVTRGEMAELFFRAMQKKPPLTQEMTNGNTSGDPPTFSDLRTDSWYASSIRALVQARWMNGFPDGTFRPKAGATRAEGVTLLMRIWPIKP